MKGSHHSPSHRLSDHITTVVYYPTDAVCSAKTRRLCKNLANASSILSQSNQLIKQYEAELGKARKEAQLEISTLQKLHKSILETEARASQKIIDEFLVKITNSFKVKKDKVLVSLESEIDSLSSQIISKILA